MDKPKHKLSPRSRQFILEGLGIVASITSNISYIPQLVQLFTDPSSTPSSASLFAISSASNIVWIVYGIGIKSPSVVISSVATVLLATTIMIIILIRKGKNANKFSS
jgi:uncharacterized protein with PQ loop repeat